MPDRREATLSAYTPTWRDRVAGLLMGDAPASPERRNFVGGLLGSTGLGSNGAGVVDATPLGGLLSMQEARNPREASLAALGLLPGAGVANKVASAAEHAAPAAERYITAYHGSPHSFDRFDINKIGTGEGAQVYGRGLYFAENEDVARGYREALAPYGRGSEPEDVAARVLQNANGDRDAALAELRRRIDSANTNKVPYEEIQKTMQARNIVNTRPDVAGSMYQVKINADPEHFLDWDKKVSQQSPAVLERLQKIPGFERYEKEFGVLPVGERIRRGLMPSSFDHASPEFSKTYSEAGIPGIKYLDQGSRGGGQGTHNYVVFNDDIVDIMKKYGLVGLLGGGAAFSGARQQGANPEEM